MYEFITLYYAWVDREWTEIGSQGAKILSDVFFKAPFQKAWTYKNSDVINENWGSPLDPWNGFIHEINYLLAFFDMEQIDLGEFQSSEAKVSQSEIDQDGSLFQDTFTAGNGDSDFASFEDEDPFGDDAFGNDDGFGDAGTDEASGTVPTEDTNTDGSIEPPAFNNRRILEDK